MSAPFEIETVETGAVSIASLKRDPELVCRAHGVNKRTVDEYAEAMRAGVMFPPVVVFRDAKGVHWLADGFHRTAAAELAGLSELAVDLREGGRREALLHAASANAAHGLRRTNADKRRAVALVIAAYPKLSDRKVGEACGVDNKTVAAVRARAKACPAGEELPHPEQVPGSTVVEAEIARLSRSIEKLVSRWPAERRPDLRARFDGWLATEPSESV